MVSEETAATFVCLTQEVLILVVVEDGLGAVRIKPGINGIVVLILVVVGDGLGVF